MEKQYPLKMYRVGDKVRMLGNAEFKIVQDLGYVHYWHRGQYKIDVAFAALPGSKNHAVTIIHQRHIKERTI